MIYPNRVGQIALFIAIFSPSLALCNEPTTAPDDGKIAVGDRVRYTIPDLNGPPSVSKPEERIVRVRSDGQICLPMIAPIKAVGKTADQLQDELRKAYDDAKLIKNSKLTITFAPYHPSERKEDQTKDDAAIVVGDQLELSIIDPLELGTGASVARPKVDANGEIPLPYIKPIKAKGLTTGELEAAISKAYLDAQMIKNARVQVVFFEDAFDDDGTVLTSPSHAPASRPSK